MATIDNVKRDYLAINRVPINDAQAAMFAAQIDHGTITEAQFVSQQITGARQTTKAELAVFSLLTGVSPSSAQLDSAVAFAKVQSAAYAAAGYNEILAPFETLGAAIATGADTKAAFLLKYPTSLSNTDFIATVYTQVTGGIPPVFSPVFDPENTEQKNGDHFLGQLAFYTKFATEQHKLSAADAALHARGAIAGQIISLAFTDPDIMNSSTLDEQVVSFLTRAAAGTAVYGAPLPMVVPRVS